MKNLKERIMKNAGVYLTEAEKLAMFKKSGSPEMERQVKSAFDSFLKETSEGKKAAMYLLRRGQGSEQVEVFEAMKPKAAEALKKYAAKYFSENKNPALTDKETFVFKVAELFKAKAEEFLKANRLALQK